LLSPDPKEKLLPVVKAVTTGLYQTRQPGLALNCHEIVSIPHFHYFMNFKCCARFQTLHFPQSPEQLVLSKLCPLSSSASPVFWYLGAIQPLLTYLAVITFPNSNSEEAWGPQAALPGA
jgi:hypothetical protein